MRYQRIALIAAITGILAIGVAACGKPASQAGASQAGPAPTVATSPSVAASPSVAPSAAPAVNPRTATCAKINEASGQLFGPLMELGTAINDPAKYKPALQNLVAATDAVANDLSRISSEIGDNELKTAIAAMVTDVQKMKQALQEFGGDPRKVESILKGGNFNSGSTMLEKLCV